ncbi:hypothetical protein KM043_001471 [Ampulex compressa]|nr:hypothetical protein KM043_001471 [Ampulex compressa]
MDLLHFDDRARSNAAHRGYITCFRGVSARHYRYARDAATRLKGDAFNSGAVAGAIIVVSRYQLSAPIRENLEVSVHNFGQGRYKRDKITPE